MAAVPDETDIMTCSGVYAGRHLGEILDHVRQGGFARVVDMRTGTLSAWVVPPGAPGVPEADDMESIRLHRATTQSRAVQRGWERRRLAHA
jgi:hypothetical protein